MNSQNPNMFFMPGMMGMGSGMPGFFMPGMPSQGGGGGQTREGHIVLNDSNQSLRVSSQCDNLVLNGHNNKMSIRAGVSNAVITGHNNKIYAAVQSGSVDEDVLADMIDNLSILGHNNRIENVIVNNLCI